MHFGLVVRMFLAQTAVAIKTLAERNYINLILFTSFMFLQCCIDDNIQYVLSQGDGKSSERISDKKGSETSDKPLKKENSRTEIDKEKKTDQSKDNGSGDSKLKSSDNFDDDRRKKRKVVIVKNIFKKSYQYLFYHFEDIIFLL